MKPFWSAKRNFYVFHHIVIQHSPQQHQNIAEPYATRRHWGDKLLQAEISPCEGDSTCAYTSSVPGAQSTTESKLGSGVRHTASARLHTI